MEWYSLRVISGKEKKVEDYILRELEDHGITDLIGEIFIPSEKVVDVRNNKKRIRDKVFFPGYILIKMEMTKESRYVVENTQNVIKFIGTISQPVPLREDEVTRIMGEVQSKEGQEVLATPFKLGDAVKVVDGPFVDFNGFVEEINEDKKKVKVSVSIFGRPTPVELDFFQVEIEK